MHLPIEPEVIWNLRPGLYRAIIIEAGKYESHHSRTSSKPKIRLVWKIKDGSKRNLEYRVQKIYESRLAKGTELFEDIETLIGAEALKRRRAFDLDILVGHEAELRVINIQNDKYPDPYVTYDKIIPIRWKEEHEALEIERNEGPRPKLLSNEDLEKIKTDLEEMDNRWRYGQEGT
jgi:hypothetical protein